MALCNNLAYCLLLFLVNTDDLASTSMCQPQLMLSSSFSICPILWLASCWSSKRNWFQPSSIGVWDIRVVIQNQAWEVSFHGISCFYHGIILKDHATSSSGACVTSLDLFYHSLSNSERNFHNINFTNLWLKTTFIHISDLTFDNF